MALPQASCPASCAGWVKWAPPIFTASRKTVRARGYIENYNPQAKTRELLAQAQAVLDEYRQYWPLTCRQIFYRLVGAYSYDKTEAAYGRLCHHLANARRARWIPFAAIRDDRGADDLPPRSL